MTEPLFFDGINGPLRTLIIGVFGYIAIVLILRSTGKRTLSKFNMFDFIVTVAFGSVLATMLLSNDVTLAEGLSAFAVLVLLQFCVTFLSTRFDWFARVVKGDPRLLFYNGVELEDALKAERVTKSELESAAREKGFGSLKPVGAMILETDGTITVVAGTELGDGTTIDQARRQ